MGNFNCYEAVVELTRLVFTDVAVSSATVQQLKIEENLNYVFAAAKAHDMAHIVSVALDKLELLTLGYAVTEKFQKEQMLAFLRYERIRYDQSRFFEALEESEIDFIALKGAVLRDYYPEPYLRTSCDIDILIHEDDLPRAINELTEKGFKTDEKMSSHDVSFYTDNGVHLELHFTLHEKIDVDDVWKTSVLVEGEKHHRLMSKEMFYSHQVAHCAKHFTYGGCGIRLFLDMWLLLCKEKYDQREVERILSTGNFIQFEKIARALAFVWFSGEKHTELTRDMQDYIFKSGIYGKVENKVLIRQHRQGSAFKYAMTRIFMPYWQLCYYYPSLRKHKILLPFCEVARWFRLVFCGKAKKSFNELKTNATATDSQREQVVSLLDRLDLK